jgi:hypothetical protein
MDSKRQTKGDGDLSSKRIFRHTTAHADVMTDVSATYMIGGSLLQPARLASSPTTPRGLEGEERGRPRTAGRRALGKTMKAIAATLKFGIKLPRTSVMGYPRIAGAT